MMKFLCLAFLAFCLGAEVEPREWENEKIQDRVLNRLIEEIQSHYAYPEAAEWLVQSLKRNQQLGWYEDLNLKQLGEALTRDLRGWTSDKHFMIAHMPAFAQELEDYAQSEPKDVAPKDDPQEASVNFGVRKVEMLDQKIGWITLDRIAFSPGTLAAFQEALKELKSAQALILDLRNNHGGSSDTLPGLLSCFFPRGQSIELAVKTWRPDNSRILLETLPFQEGPRFDRRPVVILTSKDTRSAAEAFAYHLRAFGRAFIVGERSSGGAHPADMVSLGDGFVALIPMGTVTSLRTGTDWEGRGVPVDKACSSEEAAEIGHQMALQLLSLEQEAKPSHR
ncbi:MAG: hypothetical protein DWQ01_10135 [Planctomycetota bacterium]|nr:MAG: hypothetical protein DWQ01_10135 [Planctomycetota bacterium]